MSSIKNSQISLHRHYKKIIKVSRTSFQSPVLSQEHIRNVCHTAHYYLTKFHFDSAYDSKEVCGRVTSIM